MKTFSIVKDGKDGNDNPVFILYLTFKAIDDTAQFTVASPNLDTIASFLEELSAAFPGWREGQAIKPLIQNSPELLKSVTALVEKHKGQFPHINKFSAFLRKLQATEKFFLFPFESLSQKGNIMFPMFLEADKSGKDFDALYSEITSLFGDIIDNYRITTYGERKVHIGNPIKSERVCRFCNRSEPEVTFRSVAHAISEALGNKNIILHEECDQCNGLFSQTLEHDLIEYVSLFRTLYKTPGKGGVKKYKGSNFEIAFKPYPALEGQIEPYKPGEVLTVTFTDGTDDVPEKGSSVKIPLHSTKEISFQNVYKCFCKYFLSVIGDEYLPKFAETLRWINGEKEVDQLPKIAEFFLPTEPREQPLLNVYMRTSQDKKLPFAVGEFHFTVIRYVFIIPFSTEDEMDFATEEAYQHFWKSFKHYSDKEEYVSFQNFSDNRKRKFSIELSITPEN